MRLVDLEPRWLVKDGRRIGFAFKCPNPERAKWWFTCFAVATPHPDQADAVSDAIGQDFNWLPCKEIAWSVAGGIDTATFETMTVTPSLDGGTAMWHGYITDGMIQ